MKKNNYIKDKYFSKHKFDKNHKHQLGHYEVWTDGACNPPRIGTGGWASVVIFPDGNKKELSGRVSGTTSNRMEIVAAIKGINECRTNHPIVIKTDSKYLICCVTEWMPKWKTNGWRSYDGNSVKNQDLLLQLDNLIQEKMITWKWVPSHQGIEMNERCDFLAKSASRGIFVKTEEKIELSNQLDNGFIGYLSKITRSIRNFKFY